MIPILANGMVMIPVTLFWLGALAVSGLTALVASVLAGMRRTRKAARRFSIVSVGISLAPFVVLLANAEPIRHYAQHDLPVLLIGSLVPLLLSGVAVWLSRRALPGDR